MDGRQKPRPGLEEQSRIIVDAAVKLFLEEGVRTVSIMQICHEADVSRSTFYRCFNDIDSLLQHIYNVSVFEPVEKLMSNNSEKHAKTPSHIRQNLDSMFDAIFDLGSYAELLFRESNDPNSPAQHIVENAFTSISKNLQQYIQSELNRQAEITFIKALLNANQWIAHDAIRKGLTKKARKDAKDAAWHLVKKCLDL